MNPRGISILEVIISIGLFAVVVSGVATWLLSAQETSHLSGQRVRAGLLAEEGLEAVRNIRDEGFSLITTGTYGLAESGGEWILSGSSDTTDIFERKVSISDIDTDTKQVSSEITWDQTTTRIGNVTLVTYLTNWQEELGPSSCDSYCTGIGYTTGTCRQNNIQCTLNGEVHESGGDGQCTGGPSADTCCCDP